MSYSHLEDTKPKARRPHRCGLCGRSIDKGESHIKRVGVDDGDFISFRMHIYCESLTKDWDYMDWECHDESEFRYYLDKMQEHATAAHPPSPPLESHTETSCPV